MDVTAMRRRRLSMTVAFVAAYVLILQSLLATFALGADSAAAQLDAFGNVICTHAGAAEQPSGNPQNHQPSCCTLGCSLSSLGFGAPPDTTVALETAFAETAVVAPATVERPLFSRHRWQANPRAPPLLA